jgi:hypothetical protein
MLCTPITTMHHFSVAPITGAHYFCVARQYPPRKILVLALLPVAQIFVSHTDIPHTFHSTCCTMPNFSMPPPHTNTLHAPLTKLSRDNIYPHCTRTNQTPLRSANTVHTTHAIIMCVHTTCTLLCICTLCNAKFSAHPHTNMHQNLVRVHHTPTFFRAVPKFSARTRTPTFFHTVPKFSAHTHTPTFFRAVPKFSARTHTPTFFRVVPKFSARTRTPTFFHAAPKFSACTSMPIFLHITSFLLHHAFLVRPPAHIHFYAHQFLVNSAAEIGAFA